MTLAKTSFAMVQTAKRWAVDLLTDAELAIRMLAREIPGEESIHSCLIPEH